MPGTSGQRSQVNIELKGLVEGKIYKTTASYWEFLEANYKLLNYKFVVEVLSINSALMEHYEFKQIIEGRDKIKQMLEAKK